MLEAVVELTVFLRYLDCFCVIFPSLIILSLLPYSDIYFHFIVNTPS